MANRSILIAEDDPIIRRMIVTLLKPDGYDLLEAPDGRHALNLFQEHAGKIDLLITNVNMPELTGHELASKIKQTRPDIPIIIVSSQRERDFPPEAKHHAAALLKPIEPQRLINKVRELLSA